MLPDLTSEILDVDEDAQRQYIYARSVFTALEQSRAAGKKERTASLNKELLRHQRMNWALRVGDAPRLLVEILMRLYKSALADRLIVVGPCSLYAYEAECGVRILVNPHPPHVIVSRLLPTTYLLLRPRLQSLRRQTGHLR